MSVQNRAKSTIRGKAQKIKFALLLHTVINFSSGDQEEVENIDIIPTIRTDHSAITLHLNGIKVPSPVTGSKTKPNLNRLQIT